VAAVAGIAEIAEVVSVSRLYETAPVGPVEQGPYLNAAVVVDTELTARMFLEACQDIEKAQGRERKVRWGPRTLDIDLLLFGGEVHDEPGLTVPHPRLAVRRFVLQPLVDAWPEVSMPDGTSVAGLLQGVADQQVTLVDAGRWWQPGAAAMPGPEAVLETAPLVVSAEQAAAIAHEFFGITGTAVPLEGERDRNFRIEGPDGRFALKVANPAQGPGLLAMRQQALEYLAGVDPGLAVPRAVRALGGELFVTAAIDGGTAPVRMVTYLDGDRLPDGWSTPGLRDGMAALLARLDLGLEGFSHPGGTRVDLWDLTQLPALRPHTVHLGAGRRRMMEQQIDRFERVVLPVLPTLRRQMIHSDLNPANLLTEPGDPERLIGVVDFGDLVECPLVVDLAVAAAYQCMGQQDPAAVIGGLAAAYHRHIPLTDAEIEVLPTLVAARLVQSHTISAWRAALHPENRDYILIHAEPAWQALQRVAELDPGFLGAR